MQQMAQQMQQAQMDIFHLQQQLEKYKHDTELLQKYQSDALKAEIEEAKIVGQATLDLEREQAANKAAAAAQAAAAAPTNGAGNA